VTELNHVLMAYRLINKKLVKNSWDLPLHCTILWCMYFTYLRSVI